MSESLHTTNRNGNVRQLRFFYRDLLIPVVFALCLAMVSPNSWASDTRYVADVFYVPLHSGNSTKHRIVHRGIKTGTKLTLLQADEQAGLSKVRTPGGTEGWIQNQFLSPTPIARILLADARRKQQDLEAQVANLRSSNQETTATNNDVKK